MSATYAPVGLFVYRRPEHTRQAVEALLRNPESANTDLIVFSDAAKSDPAKEDVNSVRRYVHSIRGFKSVKIIAREHNYGLAGSITDGVNSICAANGNVIVVEDDVIVSPRFLNFMNRGLAQFENNDKVMQISGYMFPVDTDPPDLALFLPIISCWGWATWKRAWEKYDGRCSGLPLLKNDAALRKEFNLGGAYDYFGMLDDRVNGKIDSWGICWMLSVFIARGVVLYPPITLVTNIGADGSGTHGQGVQSLFVASGRLGTDNPRLPSSIATDENVLSRVKSLLSAQRPNLFSRIRTVFGL